MKKITIIAAVAAFVFAACNKEGSSVDTPQQKHDVPEVVQATYPLTIDVKPQNVSGKTKAVTGYTAAQAYESAIKDVQILVFKASGEIVAYKHDATDLTQTVNVIPGTYNVCVLVNGPALTTAQQASRTAYLAATFGLDANTTDSSTGFVMNGEDSGVNVVASGTNKAEVTVKRYASRVALQKVTNKCAVALGAINIDAVWVANVVGNQSVAGEDAPSTWYNKFSRKNETPLVAKNIISASTADLTSLTYRTINKSVANNDSYSPGTPDLMYGYANSTATVVTPFATTFAATKTRLVVQATINGNTYYYPYDLDDFNARNTASTIEMIISGTGLDDPQDDPGKLKKDFMSVEITVADWEAGKATEVSY